MGNVESKLILSFVLFCFFFFLTKTNKTKQNKTENAPEIKTLYDILENNIFCELPMSKILPLKTRKVQ